MTDLFGISQDADDLIVSEETGGRQYYEATESHPTWPGGAGVTQPLSLFDTQFAAVGQGLFVPCTAAGQNSILLTPLANTPAQTAYAALSPVYGYFAALLLPTRSRLCRLAIQEQKAGYIL